MEWRHGYYADTGYTYGHYLETMPVRLRMAALVQGYDAPMRDFRYLDAGCGQGYNLVLAALAHPDSSFVGIDFMPEHVAHGRALAKRMGLENVSFIEADFLKLADNPASLGEFDYAVCHGISTWIDRGVRTALFRLIGSVLTPGGLFYNSYNTQPGWLPSMPFQHLVLIEQRSKPGPAAITAAQEHIEKIRKGSAVFDKSFPGLEQRMADLKNRDPHYLVQEYNNSHWEPMFVSQMIEQMSAVKLDYIGTATLSEAFKSHLPTSVREHVTSQTDIALREQLADYTLTQGFRRDLYAKGRIRMLRAEHTDAYREFRFICNDYATRPNLEDGYKIKAGSLEMKAPAELYNTILDRIAEYPEGMSIGQLIDVESEQRRKNTVVENVAMLVHGGWLHPILPEPPANPSALRELVRASSDGAPYTFFPLPLTGCGLPLIETDWIALGNLMDGMAEQDLPEAVLAGLRRSNRLPLDEGKPIRDEAGQRKAVTRFVTEFIEKRLPLIRRCKAL